MQRRDYLAALAAGTTVLSGCSAFGGNGDGNGSEGSTAATTETSTTAASLVEKPVDALLLERSDFENPDEYREIRDSSSGRTKWETDLTAAKFVELVSSADVYDGRTAARDEFATRKSRAGEHGTEVHEAAVAVEAFWSKPVSNVVEVVFRDANAIGALTYEKQHRAKADRRTDADPKKARRYAETMYADWRSGGA